MPNFDIQSLIGIVEHSPQFVNNPNARQMLECIKNNDSVGGQKIAENLCESYGLTPQQAVDQARKFFHF